MTKNQLLLLFTFLGFIMMAASGIILFAIFNEFLLDRFLSFRKVFWLDFHIISAIVTSLLILIHLAQRWDWIENFIFRKAKQRLSRNLLGRRRNNTWFLLIFISSLSTGLLNWMLDGNCEFCHAVHSKIGLGLILIFVFHLFKHAYPSKKYFNK